MDRRRGKQVPMYEFRGSSATGAHAMFRLEDLPTEDISRFVEVYNKMHEITRNKKMNWLELQKTLEKMSKYSAPRRRTTTAATATRKPSPEVLEVQVPQKTHETLTVVDESTEEESPEKIRDIRPARKFAINAHKPPEKRRETTPTRLQPPRKVKQEPLD